MTVAYSNARRDRDPAARRVWRRHLRSPSETARGQFAIYDLGRRLVTMIGGVRLTRGDSTVQRRPAGDRSHSGRAVMDGGAAGAPGQTGRVTGRFTVPRRTNG